MEKIEYIRPEIEIIEFETEDIITASNVDDQEDINEYYDWTNG